MSELLPLMISHVALALGTIIAPIALILGIIAPDKSLFHVGLFVLTLSVLLLVIAYLAGILS